ncbi:Glu/Leu/Phe/Val family dehydrogenase [Deminuibacter soli]|uniref:Glutamate dehydrogenase n=1 Tax=Deminuibacter soli TaxID=2291815 RepID=A0A3E1NMB5_9BACT|nr:Glu/Leu/Phe/Val dehydrogenase [Deminuibacter soli]RFM29075.1 Glu/Leu/Phe/Val dehydrogenase [Deminuibacter soli]
MYFTSTPFTGTVNQTPQATDLSRFETAAKMLGLNEQHITALKTPVKVITVHFSMLLDSGRRQSFEGYRVIHSSLLGPSRGGIRFGTSVTIQQIKALAETMTWKSALMGLPFGGAMSGIICDPRHLSASEMERLTSAYTRAIQQQLQDEQYTNDNTPAQLSGELEWLLDEFSILHGKTIHAIVTGKKSPLDNLGRADATGRGVSIITLLTLEKLNLRPYEATAAIQGFGNVGLHAASQLYDKGVKIVAISDITAAYFNADGFNIPDLIHYVQTHNNALAGYNKGIEILHEELLTLPVDILIPAAKEEAITESNAAAIKASIIIEAANNPVVPAADIALHQQERLVVPDILANAGGIIISYFEWLQHKLQETWDIKQVNTRLREILENCFNQAYNTAIAKGIHLQTAVYYVALERISAAQAVAAKTTSSLFPFN